MKRLLFFVTVLLLAGCAHQAPLMTAPTSAVNLPAPPPLRQYAGSQLIFDCANTTLSEENQAILQRDVTYLLANPSAKVLVTGYAKYQGSVNYSLAQTEMRIQAVADALKLKGVDPNRLQRVNYGPSDRNYQSPNCRVTLTYVEN